MNKQNIITYFISSVNRVSGESYNCDINIGPLHEDYDQYYCKCIAFNMDVSTLQAGHPDNYMLVTDDLVDNGYKTYNTGSNSLGSNQQPIAWLGTHNNSGGMNSGEGAHFKVKNLKHQRRIRFSVYDDGLNLEDGTYFNNTEWNAVLLLQPIE